MHCYVWFQHKIVYSGEETEENPVVLVMKTAWKKIFDRLKDSLQSDTGYGTRLTQRNKKYNDFRANLCAY